MDEIKSTMFQKLFKNRKLISSNGDGISIMQLIGFILIFIGVSYLVCNILFNIAPINGEKIAIIFFIIMLGVSFSFPKLLEGNDGLSTMRIVVFMMINVICILLLKLGWNDHVKSLADIKLDPYWMGIIAFVFGAKATQSYFESKMADPKSYIKNDSEVVG